jgi:formate-nitrite transporter family protein
MSADTPPEKKQRAEARTLIGADVVFETIRKEGEEELERSSAGLAFSALAAGLSMGFSLIMEASLRMQLPDAEWAKLISKLGYAAGFVIVVLGRQQLFTENTVTPILPLLDRRSHIRIRDVARLWSVVLAANLVGAAAFAWSIAHFSFFGHEIEQTFHSIGIAANDGSFGELFSGALFAGYLVALMAWMRPAAEHARFAVIVLLAYIIGIAGFPHIIAGSVEVLYLVAEARLSFGSYFVNYMIPTLLGNVIGGVALVAALNYAQVAAGDKHDRDEGRIITT